MKNLFLIVFLLFASIIYGQYNSLLWKITGNGLSEPSYLYGTMHTTDARVFSFSDNVMIAFNSAKTYAMELDPHEAFNMSIISKLMMGKGYSLKAMVPEREYNLLDSIVKGQVGFPVKIFDNVAPVFTMTILEAGAMSLSDSSIKGNTDVLDMYFYKQAKKKKKKIVGIETVDEQLTALNTLSYIEQANMLVNELHMFEQSKNDGKDILRFYLDQNLDSLAENDADTQMPEKFYKALVTDRNIRMADRISTFAKQSSVFAAVGALHLPKEQGIIELLRAKGFTVEPVGK